jgi:hypothetical protein
MFVSPGSRSGRRRLSPSASSGGGGGDVSSEALDALFFDQRITTLHMSEAAGHAIFSGPDGSAIHDGFGSLTYVDDESATNIDITESGCLKPLNGTTTVTMNTASSTGAGQNYTLIDRSTAVLNSVEVRKIGIYSTTARTMTVKLVKRNSANNYDVVVTQAMSHGGTGWEDCTLSSPYTVPASGTYYLGAHCSSGGANPNYTGAVARAYKAATNMTGTGQTTDGEDSASVFPVRYSYVNAAVWLDLSVASTAIAASEVPATMRGIFRMYDAAGVTLNSGVFADFTRNGGSTWTQTVLVEIYTEPGNIRVLDTGDVDVSAQSSASSLKWRWRTDDVGPKLLGAAMWGTAA